MFKQFPEEIAAVIIEPVVGNMGVVPPNDSFLQQLRDLCTAHGAPLIFDEVMTGFRVHLGGAQTLFNIKPDLTTLGKVIGGGLPVGAYGGRRSGRMAAAGPMYQAGTLSGNPLAMTAGIETLKELHRPSAWQQLELRSAQLADGLRSAADEAGVAATFNRVGTMFTTFFTDQPVTNWASAKACDTQRFGQFFRAMLERGVWLHLAILLTSIPQAEIYPISYSPGGFGFGAAGWPSLDPNVVCSSVSVIALPRTVSTTAPHKNNDRYCCASAPKVSLVTYIVTKPTASAKAYATTPTNSAVPCKASRVFTSNSRSGRPADNRAAA